MRRNSTSNARIAGTNASTAEPFGARWYFGGPVQANARATAPRETPRRRAIARAGTPSDRYSRRISSRRC